MSKPITTQNGTPVPEEYITKARYELFKLHWLMAHGYTLTSLVSALLAFREDALDEDDNNDPNRDTATLMLNWEHDAGLGGAIYPCFEEFVKSDDKFMAGHTMLYKDNERFIREVAVRLFLKDQKGE